MTQTATNRIERLKERTINARRKVSIEQARLVTEFYRDHAALGRPALRARAFAHVCRHIGITIDSDELLVGNRTDGIRAGVVFPEAAVAWYDRELDSLPTRPQDQFEVAPADVHEFRAEIFPFWRGQTLEDHVYRACGEDIAEIGIVAKINQRDHAQGHIIPDVAAWLRLGPCGLRAIARAQIKAGGKNEFLECVDAALSGAQVFIRRYAALARALAVDDPANAENLIEIAACCERLADGVPRTFRDALQSVWFLFVLLQLESNASSFSPGRLDQYLLPYFENDMQAGLIDEPGALELLECLWIKFNQIIYLRNTHSAEFFAGFPIGFNVCIGGQTAEGRDAVNRLSYLCLQAQEQLGLPQPNLSARLHAGTSAEFLEACVRVIGMGGGMPQVFNDESIVAALQRQGISHADAMNYGVVGCVELSPQGNCLGWSDAAMFNMVKALELALNHGRCLLTGEQVGPDYGGLDSFGSFNKLEAAYAQQMKHFIERMMNVCARIDRLHAELLPSAFLSSVIDGCMQNGCDVTGGGAKYNLSGIQGIQVANVADSLAALKFAVFDNRGAGAVSPESLLHALRNNFAGCEALRQMLLNKAPKFGNDIVEVDLLGAKWARWFAEEIERFTNARGGPCQTGYYTVSAHVPMGRNCGATPDGRPARAPLADGGVSAVYGRDEKGPTALLKSVARLPFEMAGNGALLNMKFLPSFFATAPDRVLFAALLRGLVQLGIHHAQFNVVRREDLIAAQTEPDKYRHLTVRVAGYTAYFTELAGDLQNEIIARTTFGTANGQGEKLFLTTNEHE